MDDLLTLEIPKVLGARYLVAAPLTAEVAVEKVRAELLSHVDPPLAHVVDNALQTSLLTLSPVGPSSVHELPLGLQPHLGATSEQIQAVAGAAGFVQVRAVYEPGWPPLHELMARAAAGTLAAQLDVPVIDTFVPQIISAEKALAGRADGSALRLADWVTPIYSAGNLGLWFTTKGLGRFGLPELQTHNVPPDLARGWGLALQGLASVLLRLWLQSLRGRQSAKPAFIEIPAETSISEPDVAASYGRAPRGGGRARVRLAFDPATSPDAESYLTVQPPHGHSASAGEHVAAVCAALFGKPEPATRLTTGHAMDQAIAAARHSLPAARARLLSGELPLQARLVVKHGAGTQNPREFVWSYVTSWSQPETVLATSAADAFGDPGIRAGRPIVIPTEEIIDWGIWEDGHGIIEGGWTNKLLNRHQLIE